MCTSIIFLTSFFLFLDDLIMGASVLVLVISAIIVLIGICYIIRYLYIRYEFILLLPSYMIIQLSFISKLKTRTCQIARLILRILLIEVVIYEYDQCAINNSILIPMITSWWGTIFYFMGVVNSSLHAFSYKTWHV